MKTFCNDRKVVYYLILIFMIGAVISKTEENIFKI